MPMSDYLLQLRQKVGHDLLVLPSAAVAIQDDGMRLLVCKHADKNIWVIPGGLIEPNEHPADAAVREMWEETGLHIELTGILGVYGGPDLLIDYPNGDVTSYIATIFRGRIIGGEPRPDGHEILDIRYLSRKDLLAVPHSKWMNTAMDVLFTPTASPHFEPATWKPE
jgi:8-oxo-dGTP pyrophosphatase MutT (NUDIX family)